MTSYLYRNRNGNYYTRVPFPLALREYGYPNEIRISLNSKDKTAAIQTNFLIALYIKSYIEKQRMNESILKKIAEKRRQIQEYDRNEQEKSLKKESEIQQEIAKLRSGIKALQEENAQIKTTNEKIKLVAKKIGSTAKIMNENSRQQLEKAEIEKKTTEKIQNQITGIYEEVDLKRLHSEFIQNKRKSDIIERTKKQLEQRTLEFIKFIGEEKLAHTVRYKDALKFIDLLKEKELSIKTIKDYKSACSQMFTYGKAMEYCNSNPLENAKLRNSKPKTRNIWQKHELTKLFSSDNFTKHTYKNEDDFWIPLILLHTGARPSEVCQLRCSDIKYIDSVACFNFVENDDELGDAQRLKTPNAHRIIPIHRKLIELGFLCYLDGRQSNGNIQLFTASAIGINSEWSKAYEQRFNRYISNLGFAAGNRPTSYSFRHTFITALKTNGILEYLISELAGHSTKSFTLDQYGKNTPAKILKNAIETIDFSEELKFVIRKNYVK